MVLLIKLLLAHFLGDFLFQTAKSVKNKEEKKIRSLQLYLHIAVHAILLIILLWSIPRFWQVFLIIILSHYLIDLGKLYLQNEKNRRTAFFTDQILHLLMIGMATQWYEPYFNVLPISVPQTLLLLLALTLLTVVSSLVIRIVISIWAPHTNDRDDESLARAGYFIGILERLFVFAFIVTDHWEGVGFLLAAKSVFRFGDLKESKDRKLTEYILIGSLLSFGLAIFIGILYARISSLLP